LVHGVVLVVGVKDLWGTRIRQVFSSTAYSRMMGETYDFAVVLEDASKLGPEGAKGSSVGDDGISVSAIVMGVNDGPGTSLGDTVDDAGQVGEIGRIERAGNAILSKTLHLEADTEGVVA
jgi:hypothetical protein